MNKCIKFLGITIFTVILMSCGNSYDQVVEIESLGNQ